MAYTTIKKPSDYFNTVLYTGNAGTQSITGVGFSPDFIWGKNRSSVTHHALVDTVRGNTKYVKSSSTAAEATITNMVTSFDSDGFSLGADSDMNGSSANQVAWNWLANGTGVANTDGSISSTVSANTTSGFSIVSYTGNETSGATVGHGLGAVPSIIICKNRDASFGWTTYHKSLGATKYIILNTTAAAGTSTGAWNNTEPTSSVFTLGNAGEQVNGSNQIAYCFAEKQGYSKFGSYTGNGNADGTFVYTGFKPAFVLVKNTQQGGDDWYMFDNKRSSFNQVQANLKPNTTSAEASSTSYAFDFLSNGFKVRASTGAINNNNETMIYMAFAEEPLVGDNPATAR